jgi:hypothetical protein
MRIRNERKDSGRVMLAEVDVVVGGVGIKGCLLTLNPEGEPRLILPDRRGGSTHDNKAVQFKSKGLRDRVLAACVETYRAVAIERGPARHDPARRGWQHDGGTG